LLLPARTLLLLEKRRPRAEMSVVSPSSATLFAWRRCGSILAIGTDQRSCKGIPHRVSLHLLLLNHAKRARFAMVRRTRRIAETQQRRIEVWIVARDDHSATCSLLLKHRPAGVGWPRWRDNQGRKQPEGQGEQPHRPGAREISKFRDTDSERPASNIGRARYTMHTRSRVL
jgi:hypothetical protein